MPQIPDWNGQGLIPPIRPGAPGHSLDRSPYVSTSLDVITRFGTSRERCRILAGWLDYRRALYESGLESGFQWLDGSFLEDVESEEAPRVPGDVDVVTFFELPDGVDQVEYDKRYPTLFDPDAMKDVYHVDAYGIQLGRPLNSRLVGSISYWYSLWSHRRQDLEWKGFLQVSFDEIGDEQAKASLIEISREFEP